MDTKALIDTIGQLDYTYTTSYSMASVIFSMKYTTACTDLVFAQRDIFQLSLGVIRPIRAKITSILRSQKIEAGVFFLVFIFIKIAFNNLYD